MDGGGVGEDRLPDHPGRQDAARVDLLGDRLGLVGDLAQRLLSVEVLAAGEEPDLALVVGGLRHELSFCP
ncbi:hypothetical protein GCM10009740_23160 [Terrabacter terrae]|uniref:Uncharacterized protein n=1 Tax=Terrabacter terrae TaxID=318434 RepID=A0ABN2UA85_9MICO